VIIAVENSLADVNIQPRSQVLQLVNKQKEKEVIVMDYELDKSGKPFCEDEPVIESELDEAIVITYNPS